MTSNDNEGSSALPDAARFSLFNVSEFPLVRPQAQGQPAGYAIRWTQEMDVLLAHGQPFVLLVDERPEDESHEDRKTKTLWLKANRDQLSSICRGLVMVEPDTEKRAATQAQGETLSKAFGLNFHVAANREEAREVALMLARPGVSGAGAAEF